MEESILKADIFFFVTTLSVVIMTVLAGALLTYCILILRDVREIISRARREAVEFIDDFQEVRKDVKDSVEDGIRATRAAARAVRPPGISRMLGFITSAILEATGYQESRAQRRRRSARARPQRDDYEDNE